MSGYADQELVYQGLLQPGAAVPAGTGIIAYREADSPRGRVEVASRPRRIDLKTQGTEEPLMKRAYREAALALLAGVAVLGIMIFPWRAHAQEGQVKIRVESAGQPLAGAQVSIGDMDALTDVDGSATLRLPPGAHQISARRFGYQEQTIAVEVEAGADVLVVIELEQNTIGLEGIVVQSTRTGRRIEDEPIRVEVLDRKEVEEMMLMAPADIAMMLNETSGLRVQTSSAALGGANVRIHGLRGRYTLILSDGLPLYGGQSGGLSMLQIPPMDLE